MSLQTVPLIQLAWELYKCQAKPDEIALKVNKDRATVYRWIAGIKRCGFRRYLNKYRNAKKGRRQKRKTDPIIKARIYAIRERYRHCCGEKIQYWMKHDYGTDIAIATIYRILRQKYQLRPNYKKNQKRGPVPKADTLRKVIQSDTVDFGELYAYTAIDIFGRDAQVVMKTGLEAKDGAEALREQMRYFGFTELLQRDGGSEFERNGNRKQNNIVCALEPQGHIGRTSKPTSNRSTGH